LKSREEIMEILEAFDLTRSLRDAGELAGCSHHTVARWVQRREEGTLPTPGEPARRERIIDRWMPKIEEWVERSDGKVRADVAFDKLRALGFDGSERTVRRAVAEVKAAHRRGRRRVYRPWITEPGMWALCGVPHRSQYAAPATMRRRRSSAAMTRGYRWWRPCRSPHSHRASR
jgi:hypothetical protein